MKQFFFKHLLQNDGWKTNVLITVNEHGNITALEENASPHGTVIESFALPGFQNAHSHGFQYAMAGLAEIHNVSHTSDDFWSWREAMYALALTITPDQMEAIATMLYTEMVRHGYTNVAEFHYVHHDKNGARYDNLAEMGSRMVAAAKTAGIGITLVPIFYQKGGFGMEPTEGQRRFISKDADSYMELLSASEKATAHYEHANIGIGIHSMRGVEPSIIAEIAASGPQDIPFHIHIAEQLKEIEDCKAYLNQRPVEWLLDAVDMNDRYHLVHATHLTDAETDGIATSKANVVLCPTTEGNLGDGLFPLRRYQSKGGNWSIGTDSHIGINPLEELRLLDYGQRLITHKRNTFTSEIEGNSGNYAIEMVTRAGRKAMNNHATAYFAVGDQLNASIINAKSPLLQATSLDKVTSAIVYTADATHQWGTIANGNLVVENGVHRASEQALSAFVRTMTELKSRN